MSKPNVKHSLAAVLFALLIAGNVPAAGREKLRVLFIGNSLTYVNDVPAIVGAIAEADGRKQIVYQTIAFPDFSLEDHWNQGDARKAIATGHWDVVVLQQGPSALPESRVLLLEYSRRFSAEIRRAGARPALFMVWPSSSRQGDFDRVSESYTLAAKDVGGILFSVGDAWRAAWRRNPALAFYAADRLHPTVLGSYLAALVIYENLCGCVPAKLPKRLAIRSKTLKEISVSAEDALHLLQAALEVMRR